MKVCKVVGTVAATVKHPAFNGHKLLAVQPLNDAQEAQGTSFLAIDRVQAGMGDRVLVLSEGNGARQILGADNLPIRSVIVGIVDRYDTE